MKRIFMRVGYAAVLLAAIFLMGGGVNSAMAAELQVSLEPVKPVYQLNEAIQFKVKGNKDFYLYLFSIDKKRNQGYLILPNDLQSENFYKSKKTHTVPGKGIEFYGERVGTEKIVILASTVKLDLDYSRYSRDGKRLSATAEIVESHVKALSVRPAGNKQERVIESTEIVVIGQ